MELRKNSQIFSLMLFLSLKQVSGWHFYTSLKDFTLGNSYPDPTLVHSEYRYGQCRGKTDLKLYAHVHLDHIQILGKIIVRGWLDLQRIPTCIILRAVAYEEDTFRSTSYNFQICVPRITYCHSHKRYKYYYYEWYLPTDLIGGMNWDIYFYGPESMSW